MIALEVAPVARDIVPAVQAVRELVPAVQAVQELAPVALTHVAEVVPAVQILVLDHAMGALDAQVHVEIIALGIAQEAVKPDAVTVVMVVPADVAVDAVLVALVRVRLHVRQIVQQHVLILAKHNALAVQKYQHREENEK